MKRHHWSKKSRSVLLRLHYAHCGTDVRVESHVVKVSVSASMLIFSFVDFISDGVKAIRVDETRILNGGYLHELAC